MFMTRDAARNTAAAVREIGAPAAIDLHGRTAGRGRGKAAAGRTPKSKRTLVLADMELQRVEDALLDALMDVHANRDNALDRLLDDMTKVEAKERVEAARPFNDADLGQSKVERIEELLVAVVMDNHPNRHKAIDRFFDDIEAREARARAEFDMQIDNDFDGLS